VRRAVAPAAVLGFLALAAAASTFPLGNFTIDLYRK